MSIRSFLQDHPAPLVLAWKATEVVLHAARPLIERTGWQRASTVIGPPEEVVKKVLFDCQTCGQCVLHYTGMTCPMTCPKQLRNGPCGGVRLNGKCEVKPEMDCVWVQAVSRAPKTPYAADIYRINPPVDWQLNGSASWATFAVGRDEVPTCGESEPRYAIKTVEGK